MCCYKRCRGVLQNQKQKCVRAEAEHQSWEADSHWNAFTVFHLSVHLFHPSIFSPSLLPLSSSTSQPVPSPVDCKSDFLLPSDLNIHPQPPSLVSLFLPKSTLDSLTTRQTPPCPLVTLPLPVSSPIQLRRLYIPDHRKDPASFTQTQTERRSRTR